MSSKKSVSVRGVKIGGGAPVSIQSMTNADSNDEHALRLIKGEMIKTVERILPSMSY